MKKLMRLFCLLLAVITISVNVSAAPIYKEGTSVVFHNASPYYIVDDVWIEGTHFTEMRNDVLFVSLNDFRTAFKCNITYNYEDTSIFAQLAEKTLWQGLGYDTIFVNDVPEKAPAPYISSAEGHPLMIPLHFYATAIGYESKWETPESYIPGVMTFTLEKVPYKIVSIEVNQAAQLVTLMGKSPAGNLEPVKHMLCSTGADDTTPNGTFKVVPLGTDWYYFPLHDCFVLYCSQLQGNICFHSLTFNLKDVNTLSRTAYNDIGKAASHGCIRLFIEDAKFIHENCQGIPVTISPGYTNAETDAIRDQIIASKLPYADYVNTLK